MSDFQPPHHEMDVDGLPHPAAAATVSDFLARPFPRREVHSDDLEPLLDIREARSWFQRIDKVTEASLYTYQLPLQQTSTADSRSLGSDLTMFSSYGYLGLNGHPRITAAAQRAVETYGTSTGGARMLTGTLQLHLELERELADFVGQPAAATYASGYDANIAAITALFGPRDCVLLDEHAHRSLVDGVRMAGSTAQRFRHNDIDDLEARLRGARTAGHRRVLVVVDGVYSMDGDEAPLADLVEVKRRHGAFLLVDESHAIGAVGARGRGTWEKQGVDPLSLDIVTGSLAKAIPSSGGFVAGSWNLKTFMQHGSSPYFFSAALSPANAAAILETLRVISAEPHHLEVLRSNTHILREGLRALGLRVGTSTTPIVPLILGEEWRAFYWARRLLEQGVGASAIPYPAVPSGTSRLRLCATGAHRQQHFDKLFDAIRVCLQEEADLANNAA